jgi:hypothetical protein
MLADRMQIETGDAIGQLVKSISRWAPLNNWRKLKVVAIYYVAASIFEFCKLRVGHACSMPRVALQSWFQLENRKPFPDHECQKLEPIVYDIDLVLPHPFPRQ